MSISPRNALAALPFPVIIEISPDSFQLIQNLLLQHKKFVIVSYKDKCVRRRISLRIRATQCTTAEEYCRLLHDDTTELDRLLKVLTIHVSQFFRNPSMFAKLRQEVLPGIFQQIDSPLRALSVGCATGEEPYSLGMVLRESFAAELAHCGVTIIGIDIDAPTLVAAKEAVYNEERLKELTPETIRRFFSVLNNKYHLAEEIKSLVTFQQGDFTLDPLPDSDLILCRNVLIYLERSQQERVLKIFAQALSPSGVLVLGKSETLVGDARHLFQPICPVERMYRLLPGKVRK